MERVNPQLNAVIHAAPDRALAAANSPQLPDGPFRGVPFLMKDIGGAEAGAPYHCGMRFLRDAGWTERRCLSHAALPRRGLVSLGRTNMPELALLPTTEPEAYGPTRNPWSLAHSAGGSSGGAAAAVAAGIVPVAHASDGGGSIRGPASMCGLVGLKPTRGRNSFGPALGERWSGFSAEFVVTRSVRDSAALLDVTAGPMPEIPTPRRRRRSRSQRRSAAPAAAARRGAARRAALGRDAHRVPRHRGPRGDAARRPRSPRGGLPSRGARRTRERPRLRHHRRLQHRAGGRGVGAEGRPSRQPGDVEPLTWALLERGRRTSAPSCWPRSSTYRRSAADWRPGGRTGSTCW